MRHLLMKMNDVGRAIPWWEMSIKTCSRRTDFDDLHIAKAKMEADAFGGLRSMTTRNPAVFSSLVARFESKRKGSRTTSRGSSRRDSGRRRT